MESLISTSILFGFSVLALIVGTTLAGCTSHKTTTMMPAPVIYHDSVIDPFAHMDESYKSTEMKVFYATNRGPVASPEDQKYGNSIVKQIHLGTASVRMGNQETNWDELYVYSLAEKPMSPMPISLEKTAEIAVIPTYIGAGQEQLSPEAQAFIASINKEIATAVDKEIMVYVHGTNVDFANSVILTSEVDHFSGRDYVGVAFAWPSHQDILAYLTGIDVKRALVSSEALKRLLVLLAEHTDAEHINILSYSAGAKVTSKALFDLRESFVDFSAEQLKEKLRLGAVVFAAADVTVDTFLERMPAISNLANQVVITVSDNDNALNAARKFMGGAERAGSSEAETMEEQFIAENHLSNVEIIDVSLGQEIRGFDITGHHYWYRHPWMSSDIVFLMRTDLPPVARGLSSTELEGVWYLSPDYPEKIRGAAKTELKGQW